MTDSPRAPLTLLAESLPETAALARELGACLYGASSGVRWIPSDEADVFVLEFDGRLPDKVVKIERPGGGVVGREQGRQRGGDGEHRAHEEDPLSRRSRVHRVAGSACAARSALRSKSNARATSGGVSTMPIRASNAAHAFRRVRSSRIP